MQGFAVGLRSGAGGSLVNLINNPASLRGYSAADGTYAYQDGSGANWTQVGTDGTNGTPRTGSTTRDRSQGVYRYVWVGRLLP